jgi:hypothetical protein
MAKNYIAGGPISDVLKMDLKSNIADSFLKLDSYYRERLDNIQVRVSELSDELIQMRGRITRMDDQISS